MSYSLATINQSMERDEAPCERAPGSLQAMIKREAVKSLMSYAVESSDDVDDEDAAQMAELVVEVSMSPSKARKSIPREFRKMIRESIASDLGTNATSPDSYSTSDADISSRSVQSSKYSGLSTRTHTGTLKQRQSLSHSLPENDEGSKIAPYERSRSIPKIDVAEVPEESDDDSDLSDISGLSDIFEELASERSSKPTKTSSKRLSIDAVDAVPGMHGLTPQPRKTRAIDSSQRVKFKNVEIRLYERILTDNPACICGPSIGLGWKYDALQTKTIDEWEKERLGKRARSEREMIMHRSKREKMLLGLGYSESELTAVVRENNRIRNLRKQTVTNLSAQKMEEVVEGMKHTMKRVLFRRKKKNQY